MFKKKKKQIVEDFTVEQDNEMSRKEEAAKIMEEASTKIIDIDFNDFDPKLEEDTVDVQKQIFEEQIKDIHGSDEVVEEEDKLEQKDLSSFFDKDKNTSKKLKKKDKKPKKASKKKGRKARDLQDVKDRKVYKYKKKKYTKVEDFVKFVNDHYLDMDKIAKEVLDDENFYGWISKRSGVFEQSLKEFKQIKEKIENL